MSSNKRGQYTQLIHVSITPKMHQYIAFLANRQDTSMNAVVRQAMREYLDTQDDALGSRSRLGASVLRNLEKMQHRILEQIVQQGKLQMAATIVLLSEQGIRGQEVVKRIADLAGRPELDKIVEVKG